MDPLLLVANAEAGSNEDERLQDALSVLREVTDVEVCRTTNADELDGVLQHRDGRRVVVAGGDGSLHSVVAALHRRQELADTILGLVPLGTGNDFARGAEIPLEPEAAARVVIDGTLTPVDLLVDSLGGVVVNNVHVGVGAQASIYATRWKKRLGRVGYVVGAAIAAVNPPFVRLHIEIDGEEVVDLSRRVLMLAIGNGPDVGGGAPITPEADPSDGKVDVMVSFSVGPLARFGYALRFRKGEHPERDDVLYRRATDVSVSGQGFYCSADGEIDGPERSREWHVERAAFQMMFPG